MAQVVLYIGTSQSNLKAMPNPSGLEWGLMDISSDDAGRLMDDNCSMVKNRLCQKRKLKLEWQNIDSDAAATLLSATNPEYFYVKYWDAMDNQWEVRYFYVGDRTAPMRWFWANDKRYSQLSFDFIEV